MWKQIKPIVDECKRLGFTRKTVADNPKTKTILLSNMLINGCELHLYVTYSDVQVRTEGFMIAPNSEKQPIYDFLGVQGFKAAVMDCKPNLVSVATGRVK